MSRFNTYPCKIPISVPKDTENNTVNKDGSLNISSNIKHGINTLYDKLSTILLTDYKYDFNNDSVLISQRQIKIFQEASILLDTIKTMLEKEIGMDVIASILRGFVLSMYL